MIFTIKKDVQTLFYTQKKKKSPKYKVVNTVTKVTKLVEFRIFFFFWSFSLHRLISLHWRILLIHVYKMTFLHYGNVIFCKERFTNTFQAKKIPKQCSILIDRSSLTGYTAEVCRWPVWDHLQYGPPGERASSCHQIHVRLLRRAGRQTRDIRPWR